MLQDIKHYYKLGWTDLAISKKLNCGRSTVSKKRAAMGLIANRKLSENKIRETRLKRIKELHKLKYTDREISEKLSMNFTQCSKMRKDLGLSANKDFHKYYNIYKDKELLGALYGTVLGDASLRGKRGCFSHKETNLDYVKDKQSFFNKITSKKLGLWTPDSDRVICGKLVKLENLSRQYICNFKSNIHLSKLCKEVYFNKNKRITKDNIKYLTPRGIAYFYQDDGGVNTGSCKFFMYNFSRNCLALFSNHLKEKYDIESTMEKKYNTVRIKQKDKKKFIDLIKPYISKSMEYKIK